MINFETLHITITSSYCKVKTMEWDCMALTNVMFVSNKTSVDICFANGEGLHHLQRSACCISPFHESKVQHDDMVGFGTGKNRIDTYPRLPSSWSTIQSHFQLRISPECSNEKYWVALLTLLETLCSHLKVEVHFHPSIVYMCYYLSVLEIACKWFIQISKAQSEMSP